MRFRTIRRQFTLAIGLALIAAGASAAPGFVPLGKSGDEVLTSRATPVTHRRWTSVRWEVCRGGGYTLVSSRSTPIVKNDITIGTLHDRVWRNSAHPHRYIFGLRVVMNAAQWDPSGLAFNVNDLARRLRPHAFAKAAYFMGGSSKALIAAGRTGQGLNEYEGAQPERDNTWVDFRVDANAADPSGVSSAESPWVLVKTRAGRVRGAAVRGACSQLRFRVRLEQCGSVRAGVSAQRRAGRRRRRG